MKLKTMIMRLIFIAVFLLLSLTLLKSQNVGIGNTDPKAKLDISGDLILKSADLSLADGNTLDLDVNTNKYNHYKLIGPTGNFQIGGINAAEHDRIITLYNRSGHSLEVYNDDVNASEPNRILTGTGGTFAVYPGGSVTLKYDNTINKWEITASHYNSLDNFGEQWLLNGNDISNLNSGNIGIGISIPTEKLDVAGHINVNGEIKTNGAGGSQGEVLTSNGNGSMQWASIQINSNEDVGFGVWGCDMQNLTEYNPAFPSDGQSVDGFGSSADLNSNFAIIGAKDATIGGNVKQGCAYIFHYDGQHWVEMQKLTASDGVANDEFGNSVAIFGNWAVVAASKADFNGNLNRGAVYIYQYNGNSWVEHQKLIDPNGQNNHEYGYDVCISPSHVVVSTTGTNNFTGAVHTFLFDGNLWIFQQTITANDGNAEDWFGFSTCVYEDKMIVGAALDSDQGFVAGSVYFFHLLNNVWTFQSKIYDITPTLTGGFGTSVSLTNNNAIIGDFNNKIQFLKFENGQWIRKTKLDLPQLSTVSISNEYAIASTGVILKSTENHWYRYEKANDPQSTSDGAVFKTVALDQGRFVMCAPTALGSMGMAIFGKVRN